MMQVVPKWKVTVKFLDREVVVFVHETHIENVLRVVAGLTFSTNPLESPSAIIVGPHAD